MVLATKRAGSLLRCYMYTGITYWYLMLRKVINIIMIVILILLVLMVVMGSHQGTSLMVCIIFLIFGLRMLIQYFYWQEDVDLLYWKVPYKDAHLSVLVAFVFVVFGCITIFSNQWSFRHITSANTSARFACWTRNKLLAFVAGVETVEKPLFKEWIGKIRHLTNGWSRCRTTNLITIIKHRWLWLTIKAGHKNAPTMLGRSLGASPK